MRQTARLGSSVSVCGGTERKHWEDGIMYLGVHIHGVIVIYCCITNYYKFFTQNNAHLLAYSSVHHGSALHDWVLCSASHITNINVSTSCCLIGSSRSPSWFTCLWQNSTHCGCSTEVTISSLVVSQGHSASKRESFFFFP